MSDQELLLKSIQYRRDLLGIIFVPARAIPGAAFRALIFSTCCTTACCAFRLQHSTTQVAIVTSKARAIRSKLCTLCWPIGASFRNPSWSLFVAINRRTLAIRLRKVPGIEMNTGALGHGLSISAGMALAAKLDEADFRVFTLLGDGELAEGSNWEAAMTAAHYRLDNLTAILDHNTLQITGRTRDVCNNEPLDEKFSAFGWNVLTADGHDLEQLTQVLNRPRDMGRPTIVIANTEKGRGVSFMEDVVKWHHGVPLEHEYQQALEELDRAEAHSRRSHDAGARTFWFSPAAMRLADSLGLTMGRANLDVFADTLLELGKKDRRVLVVTSDSRGSGKLGPFGLAAAAVG